MELEQLRSIVRYLTRDWNEHKWAQLAAEIPIANVNLQELMNPARILQYAHWNDE